MKRLGPLVFLLVLGAACADEQEGLPPLDETTARQTTSAAPLAATTSVPTATTAPPADEDPAAPWAATPLASDPVPDVLTEQWNAADNRSSCSALFPQEPEGLAPDATIRSANFAGGWAVAWDRPSGPGRRADGEYCSDCGRGAFGLAGTGVVAAPEDPLRWPNLITWTDGNIAGYGLEGDAAEDSGAPHLAFVVVEGQGCLYNVWTFLGEDHLLRLLDSLRFVEGLGAEASVAPSAEPAEPIEEGGAPWGGTALDAAEVSPVLVAEWEEDLLRREGCPLLAPAALPGDTAGAAPRRANASGELLAAWDLPSGPGRYPSGDYCADCGRGALGVGTITFDSDAPPAFEQLPVSHRWDDGSSLRVVNEGVEFFGRRPEDPNAFTDPETGDPAIAPYNAYLTVPGYSCAYRLWSFLGEEHVVALARQLRPVTGYGG